MIGAATTMETTKLPEDLDLPWKDKVWLLCKRVQIKVDRQVSSLGVILEEILDRVANIPSHINLICY